MRRASVLLAVSMLATGLVAPVGTAAASPLDGGAEITGAGFGHGVGMSQYGAYEMASRDMGTTTILNHYYPGTDVVFDVARDLPLRVGLSTSDEVELRTRTTNERPVRVHRIDGDDDQRLFRAPAGETITVAHDEGTTCAVTVDGESEQAPCGQLEVRWTYSDASPGTLIDIPRDDAHDLALARGKITFDQPSDRDRHGDLHTVLDIEMREYLYGLAEVPSSWPEATLRAQAVTGRTFAARREESPRGASCSCDLLTTVSDQHYNGWSKEAQPGYGHRWVEAVDASTQGGQGAVVRYQGALAQTFYSSSNAGATEDSRDIWGGSIPYLIAKDDPYSRTARNPNRSWSTSVTFNQLTDAAGLDWVSDWEVERRNRSGSTGELRFHGSIDGQPTSRVVDTTDFRRALGLRSHAISDITITEPTIPEWMGGDFTGDGQEDALTYVPATGDWLLSRSTGDDFAFEVAQTFATRDGWAHHVVGDFDGDGADDVASFNEDNGTWWVSSWDGERLRHARWGQIRTRSGWEQQLAGDFNGDGRDDVALYHPGAGTWWVLESQADGSFAERHYQTWQTRTGWSDHLVGDLTGDGTDDIASYHPGAGSWWIEAGDGAGFTGSRWARFSPRSGWEHHLGDTDGDDRAEIVSYYEGNGTWWVGDADGEGPKQSLQTSRWSTYRTTSGWGEHVIGDFDGDGRDDVASYHPSNGSWWVNRSAHGGFSLSQWGRYRTRTGWAPHLVGDADGDGDDDLLAFYPGNRSWWVSISSNDSFSTNSWGQVR